MNEELLHVAVESGSVRRRACPPGDPAAARRFVLQLRDGQVAISSTWTVSLTALPPGGYIFDVVHAQGVTVARSWLCFRDNASAMMWQRIYEDVTSRDVHASYPGQAPWLATSSRAGGLALLMGDDRLSAEADSVILRTGWALMLDPHDAEQTTFPGRRGSEPLARA